MKKIFICILLLIALALIIPIGINYYVINSTKKQIITMDEAANLNDVDCILVLGAGIRNNKPSDMLRDRLIVAKDLYENGVSNKIIASGDHGNDNYDEVNVMKSYLTEEYAIASADIFMDHAGFSTYDSIYRTKEIFEVKKVVIVTQKYHLSRALYLANKMGIEAYGVSADLEEYRYQSSRDIREFLARNKDFILGIILPKPKYLGDTIPVSGDGDITNDK